MKPATLFKVALAAALLGVGIRAALPDPRFTVTVLDVGQGDAILAQCGTHQVLIDGGPDGAVLSRLGRRMPFFDRHVDAVVLSHPHADHYLGLIPVFARYDVGALYTAGMDAPDAEYGVLLDAAAASGVAATPLAVSDRIEVGECGHLLVIAADATPDTKNPNDASVVLRAEAANAAPRAAVLLTGDATEVVERALVDAGAPLAADAIKVGHHGSKSSSSEAFLAAVQPRIAAISVGAKNSYRHPSHAALDRFAALGTRVFRTDTDGDIVFVLTADAVTTEAAGK